MHRRRFLGAAGVAALVGVAGCSGGGDGSTAAVGDWLADANGGDEPVDRTGTDQVTVAVGADDGFAFDPAGVDVSPGTSVVWEWTGRGSQHNVVHEDGAFRSEYARSEGYTFEHRFESTGVYRYYCEPHRSLGMQGAVRVVA